MALSRVRPAPLLACVAGVVLALLGASGVALAGKHDLQLLNLCRTGNPPALGGSIPECGWVQRDGAGLVSGVSLDVDPAAQSNFRSLMSELGVAIAPRLQTPADTLGYAGFQFSAELAMTKISADREFWDGTEGLQASRTAARPDSYLTMVGGFVRKGIWLPLPAFELGAGAMSILGSRMYTLQGYAKFALQEGFHGWALPSIAARGGVSQLLGTDQVDLTVFSVDVLASKAFSLAGTARVEPFLGWSMLFIFARSGVIDATPGCDAYQVRQAAPGDPAPSARCAPAQNGTWNDLEANFTFPDQDVITRQRWYGGLKLRLSVLFMVGQYEISPKGTSTDETQSGGARDGSGTQQTFSVSAGFDF